MAPKHVPHKFVKQQHDSLETIASYMATSIQSIDATAMVQEAGKIMQDKKIGSLLVRENENYVGIITETDLTRKVIGQGRRADSTKVSEIMNQPLITMESDKLVTDANQHMAKNKVRHLIITEKGKVVGILSVRDLVHFFANPRMRTW